MRLRARLLVTAALLGLACADAPAGDDADDVATTDTAPAAVPSPPAETPPAAGREAAPDDDAVESERPPDAGRPEAEPPAGGGAAGGTAIPARFRGEWNADRSACGTASEMRLRIEADRIRFYESAGRVRAVERVSDRVIVVTAVYQGEGETWEEERRLSLSEDGDRLTVSGGTDVVRYRCG